MGKTTVLNHVFPALAAQYAFPEGMLTAHNDPDTHTHTHTHTRARARRRKRERCVGAFSDYQLGFCSLNFEALREVTDGALITRYACHALASWAAASRCVPAEFTKDVNSMPAIDVLLKRVSKYCETHHLILFFLWDEVQFLLKPLPGNEFRQCAKGVFSNPKHINMFHLLTGSGMGIVWDAFEKAPVQGHSLRHSAQALHLPVVTHPEVMDITLRELKVSTHLFILSAILCRTKY